MKPVMVCSFSGGRTSAYMAKWLIDNKSNEFDLKFVFANTGLEHEKTLDFINRCDNEWRLNLDWIEAVTHKELGKGQTYKVVDFNAASRSGEPYKLLASIEGIPCPTRPICTDRLKSAILIKYRNQFGKKARSAIGIRIDEIDRMNPNFDKQRIIYPLISMRPTTKSEILDWWRQQPFDLEIEEHLGNCVTCWKKSDRKLLTIAKNHPESFEVYREIEKKHSSILSKKDGSIEGVDKKIFRNKRSVNDIFEASKGGFVEFKELDSGYQLDLLGLDSYNGCSESCEPF
jgi:hypothetical protein